MPRSQDDTRTAAEQHAMFPIDQAAWPTVQTRRALVVLDFLNDFLTPTGRYPVAEPPHLEERVLELAAAFRSSGTVIWVRCVFEASRAVNDGRPDSERVITDADLRRGDERGRSRQAKPGRRAAKSRRDAKDAEEPDEKPADNNERADEPDETFLTKPHDRPNSTGATAPGSMFTQGVLRSIDSRRDWVFIKTYYSALRGNNLLSVLRMNLITELFLCGSLSNIGVFATALDASAHGYSITLVEDCLGYRSRGRHDEALRQLSEATGCDYVSSTALLKSLPAKPKLVEPADSPPPAATKEQQAAATNATMHAAPINAKLVSADGEGSSSDTDSDSTGDVDQRPAEPPAATSYHHDLVVDDEPDDEPDDDLLSTLRLPKRAANIRRTKDQVPGTTAASTSPQDAPDIPVSDRVGGRVLRSTSQPSADARRARTASTKDEHAPSEKQQSVSTDAPVAGPPSDKLNLHELLALRPKVPAGARGDTPTTSDGSPLPEKEDIAPICAGDTWIIPNLLPDDRAETIFEEIRDEVQWQTMHHQGGEVPRLVAVQGEMGDDGCIPIYRHPADESPPLVAFTAGVLEIRAAVEAAVGHRMNHVLIQLYRDGADYISEHSDKTLDIAPDTFIANVSLGAQRTMTFRTKAKAKAAPTDAPRPPRTACRAPLPHNSLCKMGLRTNMRWLHSIRQDKRAARDRSAAELAYHGARISLTFRSIATFLSPDQRRIWGQGATAKRRGHAQPVINGACPPGDELLKAFGRENQSTDFDWHAAYGAGFDVLHLSSARKLYSSGDELSVTGVILMLAELKLDWTAGLPSPPFRYADGNYRSTTTGELPARFVDNDAARSTVDGAAAIMLYLDDVYGHAADAASTNKARQYTRFVQAHDLCQRWGQDPPVSSPRVQQALAVWAADAQRQSDFIGGPHPGIADFMLWPALHRAVQTMGQREALGWSSALAAYHERMRARYARVLAEHDSERETARGNAERAA